MAIKIDNFNFLAARLPLVRSTIPTTDCLYTDGEVVDAHPVLELRPGTQDIDNLNKQFIAIKNLSNQLIDQCVQIPFEEEDSSSSSSDPIEISTSSSSDSSSSDTSDLTSSTSSDSNSTESSSTTASSDTSNSTESTESTQSSSTSISSDSSASTLTSESTQSAGESESTQSTSSSTSISSDSSDPSSISSLSSGEVNPVTAKSVVFDIADNHGGNFIGVRSIEFYSGGAPIAMPSSSFTAYATTEEVTTPVEDTFDTTTSKTGNQAGNQWLSAFANITNQRIIIVFNTEQTFDEIVINNSHQSGNLVDRGAKDTKITYSPDEITDTTYNAAVSNGIELNDTTWPFHVSSNIADDQTVWNADVIEGSVSSLSSQITSVSSVSSNSSDFSSSSSSDFSSSSSSGEVNPVTTKSVIFDIADNYGNLQRLGVRLIAFHFGGVEIPLDPTDYTTYATTNISAVYNKDNAFDTTQSLIGSAVNTNFESANGNRTNQRLIVVFNTEQTFDEIVVNNAHSSGTNTNFGARNVKISYSPDAIADTTYDAAISNGVELNDTEWPAHNSSDTPDPETVWSAPIIAGSLSSNSSQTTSVSSVSSVSSNSSDLSSSTSSDTSLSTLSSDSTQTSSSSSSSSSTPGDDNSSSSSSFEPGVDWTLRSASAIDYWAGITYGETSGLFVAVAAVVGGVAVMSSPDAITWTTRTASVAYDWRVIASDGTNYVGIPLNGTATLTSADGVFWGTGTCLSQDWRGITTDGAGLWVAVGNTGLASNAVMTSSNNGASFTYRTGARATTWNDVAYGAGLFVAVADFGDASNKVMTSPDGITWTHRTSFDHSWNGITFGGGQFVAVASGNVMTSPDGITWTLRTCPAGSWRKVSHSGGVYAAVAFSGTDQIMTSPDGITWTVRTKPAASSWWDIAGGSGDNDGVFAATALVGSSVNEVMSSP